MSKRTTLITAALGSAFAVTAVLAPVAHAGGGGAAGGLVGAAGPARRGAGAGERAGAAGAVEGPLA